MPMAWTLMLVRTSVRKEYCPVSDTLFEVRLNQRLVDDFDQVARASGLTRA